MVLSTLAISQFPLTAVYIAVLRWYKKNVMAGVKDLGIQGETVSRSSPETRLALNALLVVSAWAHVHLLF